MRSDDPRFRWVLLASVALNVLLATALASAWYQHGRRGGPHGALWMPRAEVLEKVVPDSDRAALRAAYERHRDDVRPRIRALREARRAVHEALHAEPYDEARALAALEALRARDAEVALAVHELLLDVTRSVSPEGRRAIAKMGERHRHHRRENRERERER